MTELSLQQKTSAPPGDARGRVDEENPQPKSVGQRSSQLTEGSVTYGLLSMSFPILISSVLMSINGSVNAAWIGHLLGTSALSASINANTLLLFLSSLSGGIGIAASIAVGRAIGGNDTERAKKIAGGALAFFGATAVIIALVGSLVAPQLLTFMGTPAAGASLAAAYLRVAFIALPGTYLYSCIAMILRGAGDNKTPTAFLGLSVFLDVILNPILIQGIGPLPGLGIAGSALASSIAQWVTLFALIAWIQGRDHLLRLHRSDFHYLWGDRGIASTLVRQGVPIGLLTIISSSSLLAMIGLVNHFGVKYVAAYATCFQLWTYVQMPSMAVSAAVSTVAAHNIGAGRWDRVERVAVVGSLYNVVITGALLALALAVDTQVFAIFLGTDTASIEIARHINHIVAWAFILFGISFAQMAVVRANGAVMAPLIIMAVVLWGVRIPFATFMMNQWGSDGVFWSTPISAIVCLLLTTGHYCLSGWRKTSR